MKNKFKGLLKKISCYINISSYQLIIMIKFYTNKELSQQFNINLAKWKRWSREFLPPDPLGGLQSGFARQYNPNEAFTVYLGGHLVRDLKFTIPETKKIINDLHRWLLDHNYYLNYSDADGSAELLFPEVKSYQIAIICNDASNDNECEFSYVARGILTDETTNQKNKRIRQERFIIDSIGPYKSDTSLFFAESHRVLSISNLRNKYKNLLQGEAIA